MDPVFSTSTGFPVPFSELETVQLLQTKNNNSAGYGPQLLQDINLIDDIRHFSRERIPERVLHAKGAGAHGTFTPTMDLSKYTIAHPFQPDNLNKGINATARFSTVSGQAGSADTVRTFRGFAVKLKTDVGNWDWVFINFPVFSIRDPAKLIGIAHAQSRDPRTNSFDPDRSWDNFSSNPEMVHQLLYTFGDYGITDGYPNQDAYSINPFSWVNKNGDVHYVKMKLKAPELKFLTSAEAVMQAGINPDYNSTQLYNTIEAKNYPKWDVQIQVMSLDDAEKWTTKTGYSVFDATKYWPEENFPLMNVGKLELNANPDNYFAEIEQLAFAPSTLIPGIIPSPDPILQTRLFFYGDTQCYRLGVNLQQLPANKPKCPISNFQRDGFMTFNNQAGLENYNTTLKPHKYSPYPPTHQDFIGTTVDYLSVLQKHDFEQPMKLWQDLKKVPNAQRRLIDNVVGSLKPVKLKAIKLRQLQVFATVDLDLAKEIGKGIGLTQGEVDAIKPIDFTS